MLKEEYDKLFAELPRRLETVSARLGDALLEAVASGIVEYETSPDGEVWVRKTPREELASRPAFPGGSLERLGSP